METAVSSIESLVDRIETYGKTTYELSKLKLLETTINVVTALVPRQSVIIMVSLFALVLNIGIALLLGELIGRPYYGFFIVAGFYLVAAIILHFFMHKWVKKPISDLIIKQALQ